MKANHLDFSYGNTEFIKDLNISIEKGKITTILGPNGSGKSTLLNLFINQLSPHAGEIMVEDIKTKSLKMKEIAQKIAIVHQQNFAPSDITIEHLVSYGRTPYRNFLGMKDDDEDDIVSWALEATKLTHMKDKSISNLSGGEKQRAWIALALAQKTDILFLDEPTTYLDIYYQLEVLELVRELNRQYNMTIIMVLHDINQALQFSHNVVIMKKGNIVFDGNMKAGITEERIKDVYGINNKIRWCDINDCPYMVPILTPA